MIALEELISGALSGDTAPVPTLQPSNPPTLQPSPSFTPLGATLEEITPRPWTAWPQGWRDEAARIAEAAGTVIDQGWCKRFYCVTGEPGMERHRERGEYVPPSQGPRYSIDGALEALTRHPAVRQAIYAILCTLADLRPHMAAAPAAVLVVPDPCTPEEWAVASWNDALPARGGQQIAAGALRWAAGVLRGENAVPATSTTEGGAP